MAQPACSYAVMHESIYTLCCTQCHSNNWDNSKWRRPPTNALYGLLAVLTQAAVQDVTPCCMQQQPLQQPLLINITP